MSDPEAQDARTDQALRAAGAAWRSTRSACPDPDLLLARRSDVLDEAARRALAAHLDVCEACAQFAADVDRLALDEPDAGVPDRVWARIEARRRGPSRWLPLAAILVLATAASAAWWTWTARRTTETSRAAPAPGGTSPERAETASPSRVIALWAVDPAPVWIPATAVGTLRSAEHDAAASGALLQALEGYRAGRYAESIAPLLALTESHPDFGDAAFYLGVSYLLSNRPADAAAVLGRARAIARPDRHPEIDWYLATAEQRSGQNELALRRLRALCDGTSQYRTQACGAARLMR